MLNRDFAGTTARIASTTNITPVEQVDYAGALKNFLNEYRTSADRYEKQKDKELLKSKTDALTNAIKGGNQDEINNALATVDPVAYAQMLKSDAQRAEDRKWALDDMATKHRYDLELAKAKDKEFTTAQRNMAYLQEMGYSPKEAAMLVYGGQNPSLDMAMLNSKGQDAYAKEIGKSLAEEQIAEKQLKTLTPRAKQALERAKASLDDGTGLGQIGGWGWTTGQGGINRANVSNAQAQINTAMRGLLSNMGVGSSELNSAAEAEAYRYMIKPDMPIEQQRQVLKNFEDDYLSGKLEQDLRGIYGKSLKDVSLMSDPRVKQALAEGYSLEQIKSYLGK
jgi:hypothetical protein